MYESKLFNVEDLSTLSDLVKKDAYDEADLLHIIKSDNSENAQKVKELIKSLKPTENLPEDDEYTCTKYVRIYPDGTGNWEKLLPNNISKEYQLIIKSAEYLVNNCDYYYDSTSMDQYLNEMLGHNWVTDKEFADAYLSYMR